MTWTDGVFPAHFIPFTGELDVASILEGHRDVDYTLENVMIYLVNIDPDSSFGTFTHLDVGNGNFPVVLERQDKYWENDPRGETVSLVFEEVDEDLNEMGNWNPPKIQMRMESWMSRTPFRERTRTPIV